MSIIGPPPPICRRDRHRAATAAAGLGLGF